MKELSIFVDESGDFGKFERHSPFYIFALVVHDQSFSITEQIKYLENDLRDFGLSPDHCFHIGPLLRREEDYSFFPIQDRRKLLYKMISFTRNIHIKYATFHTEKTEDTDAIVLTSKLSRQLHDFLEENKSFFADYDKIILYYDNGQIELGRLLAANLSSFPKIEYRKVQPSNYRLFQVADLICSLTLVELKNQKNTLSHTEKEFFGNMHDFHKNFYKPIERKKF